MPLFVLIETQPCAVRQMVVTGLNQHGTIQEDLGESLHIRRSLELWIVSSHVSY